MKPSTVLFIIGVFVFISTLNLISSLSSKNKVKTAKIYHYFAKESLMTTSENDFFDILSSVIGDKYYIFPQVHLSAIFDEKIYGQPWRTAFRSINQKSVDYVIADKMSRKPLLAIELDDPSHDREDRQARDKLVERIFSETTTHLVRFSNYKNFNQEQIRQKLFEHLG